MINMSILQTLPIQISDIIKDYKNYFSEDETPYEKTWEVSGWVRDFCCHNDHAFLTIYDGSTPENFQIYCKKSSLPNFDIIDNLRGATVKVSVLVKKSSTKEQDIEIVCQIIEPIGLVNDKNSIILSETEYLESLRAHHHFKPRFKSFNYIYKIRSKLLKYIHKFFHNNNFYNLDPNIITTSDCEGTGEVFTITTLDHNKIALEAETIVLQDLTIYFENQKKLLSTTDIYKNDFFEKQAFLTTSSQLQLETLCSGLSRVYTLNPSFRAEKSKPHLACFTHLEWEIAFIDIHQLMDLSENLIKTVISNVLSECYYEYIELDKFLSKGIIDKLNNVVSKDFVRITYDKAIELISINKKNIIKKFSKELLEKDIPKWGDNIGSFCERYISEDIYKCPVFIYNYPKDLKSFYMKVNDDGKTVQAVDLIVNGIGELISSSIREESYEKLITRMDEKLIDKSVIEWYIDFRKNSTFPHGGAGLVFDSLVNFCSLINGNRDIFPT